MTARENAVKSGGPGLSKCEGPFCVAAFDLQRPPLMGLSNRGGYLPDFTVGL